ncbi:hypothetical protein PQQ53_33630 [Paraburkholderia strydomiana]|uniref:shikimate dehydrogenase family protein n=1 Tax=Paraburkholderia strydomiana TaxID=1245417 RepID=UPI0038BB6674
MRQIDGETKIVAILGDPIAQAKSPELFNALFERHAVNAVLIPMHVPPAQLGAVLDGLRGIVNLAGVVVTVPHKFAAAAYAANLSDSVRQTGGVNCLRREADGTWSGAMFDGSGFVKGLAACGQVVRNKSVLLVGNRRGRHGSRTRASRCRCYIDRPVRCQSRVDGTSRRRLTFAPKRRVDTSRRGIRASNTRPDRQRNPVWDARRRSLADRPDLRQSAGGRCRSHHEARADAAVERGQSARSNGPFWSPSSRKLC